MIRFFRLLSVILSLVSCGKEHGSTPKAAGDQWVEVNSQVNRLWRKLTSPSGECVAEYMATLRRHKTTGKTVKFHEKQLTWLWCNDNIGASATDGELVFFKPVEKIVNSKKYLFVDVLEDDLFRNDFIMCAYIELQSEDNISKSQLIKSRSISSHYESARSKVFTHLTFDADASKVGGCYKFLDLY